MFKNNGLINVFISDVGVTVVSILTLFLLFQSQPDSIAIWKNHGVIVWVREFVLVWLPPFTTLVIAFLTYKNILLTKESTKISERTLKQMQLSDQKNTAPMLNFELSIGYAPNPLIGIDDDDRPREIKLWDAKSTAEEKEKPHYLIIKLKNLQEHPHGVAIDVELAIAVNFPICEDTSKRCKERIPIKYTYMDAKEVYEESVMKISGMPSLSAEVVEIKYRDMFGQQYVVGYGMGAIDMSGKYLSQKAFVSLIGNSPDTI